MLYLEMASSHLPRGHCNAGIRVRTENLTGDSRSGTAAVFLAPIPIGHIHSVLVFAVIHYDGEQIYHLRSKTRHTPSRTDLLSFGGMYVPLGPGLSKSSPSLHFSPFSAKDDFLSQHYRIPPPFPSTYPHVHFSQWIC